VLAALLCECPAAQALLVLGGGRGAAPFLQVNACRPARWQLRPAHWQQQPQQQQQQGGFGGGAVVYAVGRGGGTVRLAPYRRPAKLQQKDGRYDCVFYDRI
jgi:hypothetical protein